MANHVTLFGNLGADPELRVSASGVAVLKLRLATTERVKKGENWENHTEWHSVTVFGKRAEGLSNLLTKGSKLLVNGKLRTTSYEKDGQKRYNTEIIADDVELAGTKRDSAPTIDAQTGEDTSYVPNAGDSEIPF